MAMCKCGGLLERKQLDRYVVPGALLGVENVTLVNAVTEEICGKCGKSKVHIPDLPGLITAVALTRVKLPFKLNHRKLNEDCEAVKRQRIRPIRQCQYCKHWFYDSPTSRGLHFLCVKYGRNSI